MRRMMSCLVAALLVVPSLGCSDGPRDHAGDACATCPGAQPDASSGARDDAGDPGSDAGPLADAASAADGGTSDDAGTPASTDAGPTGGAAEWIRAHFAGAPAHRGDFRTRTRIETPALVHDATGCCAKYAFDVRETTAPDDPRVGFVDVTIRDLVSPDAYGGGIATSRGEGVALFLARVTVEPDWPAWVSYAETNYDGLVLDGASAIYAEDLTIRNWNADGAIDNKATISQLVRLTIEGRGNRGIRYWRAGPHYLVDSALANEGTAGEGSLLWFRDCDTVEVRVYDTTFNGEPSVPSSLISCDTGSDPEIVYLTTDPRTTGEMHPMFTAP